MRTADYWEAHLLGGPYHGKTWRVRPHATRVRVAGTLDGPSVSPLDNDLDYGEYDWVGLVLYAEGGSMDVFAWQGWESDKDWR